MLTYCAVVATLTLLLLAVHTVRKEQANNRILGHLKSAESRELQMWDVLTVIKGYQESARVHHKEADVAKKDVVETVTARADELAHKIEEVPGRVADAIKTDSGVISKSSPRGT